MTYESPIIFVVDDDASVRPAMESLIRSVELRVKSFASANDFLSYERSDAPACLVQDVRLPGLSGLDLQKELAATGNAIPIIFITAIYKEEPFVRKGYEIGAVDYFSKPFSPIQLLNKVYALLE